MAECKLALLTSAETASHHLHDRLDNVKSIFSDRLQLPHLLMRVLCVVAIVARTVQ